MNAYVIALFVAAQSTAGPDPDPPTSDAVLAGDESIVADEGRPSPAASTRNITTSCPIGDEDLSEATRRAKATKLVRRADTLFGEARYGEALGALNMAECHWPDSAYDFMRGTIEKRRGGCDAATRAFERYLGQNPPDLDADLARTQIRECREEATPMTQVPPVPSFGTVAPDSPPPTPTKPWIRDVPGGVLFGVGVAGTMVGAGFLIANRLDTELPEMYDGYVEIEERRSRRQSVGTGLLVASSTLIAASIVRYVWVGRRNRRAGKLARVSLFAPQASGSSPALMRW